MIRNQTMYKEYENQRKLTQLFISCVQAMKKEDIYPLDQNYTQQQMKNFITNHFDEILECDFQISNSSSSLGRHIQSKKNKMLIKELQLFNPQKK